MNPNLVLITKLKESIDCILKMLIPAGSRVALLEYPNHHNVGDAAIWLGEKAALKRLGCKIVYQCDYHTYREGDLRSRIGNAIILIHGGGSFGDVWADAQKFREKVITQFPKNRIIQLPQTLYFSDNDQLLRAQEVYNHHEDLILLLRDRTSYEYALKYFATHSYLCPDMAFALGPLTPIGVPTQEFVYLKRTDREAPAYAEEIGLKTIDWIKARNSRVQKIYWELLKVIKNSPRRMGWLSPYLGFLYDRFAADNVDRGIRMLSQGETVVTDRLHAHILAILIGKPSIVLDNNYGKIRGFYNTWMKDSGAGKWAESPSEAIEILEAEDDLIDAEISHE